jgi:HlyD family secretion protein
MALLFPVAILENSTFSWLPRVTVRGQLLYTILLGAITVAVISLFYIRVDVVTTAPGLVRPSAEKNEVRSPVAGTIAEVMVSDGSAVRPGQVLLRLRQEIPDSKLAETTFDLGEHNTFIHDLTILVSGSGAGLLSTQYQQQYARFQSQLAGQRTTLAKLRTEVNTDKTLLAEKVIAPREYQDKEFEYQKALDTYQASIAQQRSDWEDQRSHLSMERSGLSADASQLKEEREWSLIRAPLGGTLQQFEGKSAGGYVQAGEILGLISPDSGLVAECYVSPRDIGYVHPGMAARFQVDAFNYTDWGMVDGKVTAVGSDYIMQEGRPMFKVRCAISKTDLHLIKGMTLQARFLLTRRTLYQLLYQRASQWVR